MYDASIHVWQFSLDDETRIRCKNSQVAIASKKELVQCLWDTNVIWVVSYVENTEVDNLIWETLSRSDQDVFYPWMDVYHTIKHIQKVRDSDTSFKRLSLDIEDRYWCSSTGASMIAWAVLTWCSEVHTLYEDILDTNFVDAIQKTYGIVITKPPLLKKELLYTGVDFDTKDWRQFDLENLYNVAMSQYRSKGIDLLDNLFALRRNLQSSYSE